MPLATGLHVTPNPVASPAGRPLQWSTYYPPHILNLDNIVRQAAADRQARVALAQELGYALSLVEVSNGRRHAVIVGTGFTRILVRSPDEVFIELRDWHPEAGLSPHPVLIRELLATVGQTHLGHFLLDRYDRIDHVPLQLYLDLYARSVHDRLSHATVPHLSALHSDSDAELDFDGSTAFSVDRAHRLRVVATARQSKLAGTAKQREKEDTGAQSGACGIGSGGGGGGGGDGGGNGGGSGGESGGSGGFPPVAGEGGREGGGRGAGGQGGPSARSGSAASAQSGGTSHSMSDLIFDLDLGGLDIAAELTPADIAAVNPTNASLPLGADAQTYAAARSKQEEQTDDDEEETRFQLPEPTPAAWASFVSKLDHAESSLEAKQVLEDRAHLDCTLALFAEVLDERERAGCRFVVVSPAQMEELLDRGSAAAEQRFAERFAERHGSQAPVGFPADVSARSPPDLTQSDSTDSPSPVLSALMPTVPSPPSTDADAVAPETDKGAAPSEHFRVWDAEHA